MPSSKKPRRAYRGPKFARGNVASLEVLNKHSVTNAVIDAFVVPLDTQERRDVAITFLVALDRMVKGKANADDLGYLGFMCNTARMLCERGFVEDGMDDVIAAQEALMRADERARRGAGLALDGDGIRVVREAYWIHEAQIEVAGRGHLLAAGKEVTRRQLAGDILELAA
ncbi:hypothetical protein PQR05_29670 [Paraburkholderia sediminicola]|uniref:hypothetical protein n=1 Tax=Paraburkholderia sediminicola TaxID=458836 RepID=UPI0038BD8885